MLATATDFNGNSTTLSNTSCNNAFPSSITPPLIHATNLTWDCTGGVVTNVTDANTQPTNLTYDSMWRVTNTGYADGGSISADYTHLSSTPPYVGTSVLVSAGAYHHGTQTLDGLGRVIHSTDTSAGSTVDTTYNNLGQVYSVSNPYISTNDPTYGLTTYAYDALSRVTSITYPDNNTASVSYAGNCATSTDAASKSRKICSDALGRTISVNEDPGGLNYATTYSYDTLDNLTGVTQGSQTRAYVYDMLSRLTSATTPESGTTAFTYDANGNVQTRTDARNITTSYSYDALNRLQSKTYSDGTPTANFYYDETSVTIGAWTSPPLANTKGRLTHTTATSGTTLAETVNSYDAMGRPSGYWQCAPVYCGSSSGVSWANSAYGYDLAGDLISYGSPAGFTVTNTVNGAQQVTLAQSSYVGTNYPPTVGSFTYTPFGALATLTDGCTPVGSCTPAVETYNYNNRLQPVMIQLSSPGVTNCLVYNYYTVASNPTTCAVPSYPPPSGAQNNGNVMGYYYSDPRFGHTNVFGYDSLNRQTSAQATASGGNSASYNWTYNFDQFGNMQCSGSTGGVDTCAAMTYNTSTNRIDSIGLSNPVYPTYDAAGNLLSNGTGTGSQSYTWDAEGRLTTVSSPAGSVIATYNYNALGQRVQATGSGIGTYPEVQAFDAFGNVAYLGDRTTWGDQPFPPVAGRIYGKYDFYFTVFSHTNALGSEGTTTLSDGEWASSEIFDPWGQRWAMADNLYNEHFAAMLSRRDAESGNDHTQFRQYMPNLGRWTSPDPLAGDVTNPQSLNRYAYVLNNPCTLTDQLGLDACDFNGQFINDAGLTSAQVTAAEQQINQLLGSVPSTNGDTVGINWVTSGQTDATLTATNQSWIYEQLPWTSGAFGAASLFLSPRVYINNLESQMPGGWTGSLVGAIGLHELAHDMLATSDLPYDKANPNTLMYDNAPPGTQTNALLDPNSNLWKLSSSQVGTLFQNCKSKHGSTPSPGRPGGGGGGYGGGSSSGGGWVFFDTSGFDDEGAFVSGGYWVWWPGWPIGPRKE